MGRTNPTYRDLLRAIEDQWGDYRRALRRREQPYFDRLFDHARRRADAAGAQNHDDPMVSILPSIAIAQQRRITLLEERLEENETSDSGT